MLAETQRLRQIVADSHTLLHYLVEPERLSKFALEAEDADGLIAPVSRSPLRQRGTGRDGADCECWRAPLGYGEQIEYLPGKVAGGFSFHVRAGNDG